MSRRRRLQGGKLHLTVLSLLIAAHAFAGGSNTASLIVHQGAQEASPSGDYVMSTEGMDEVARYWIEVTPSLSRLVVDIYDADIGIGGAAEVAAQLDRDRGDYDTSAVYSLFSPNGVACPVRFTTGTDTLPAGANASWLTFFDEGNYRDQFNANNYANNQGTLSWTGNWLETNDDNLAGSGNIRATGNVLQIRNANNMLVRRQANLDCYSTATLTFTTATAGLDNGDQYRIEVSNNGGVSWTTLQTVTAPAAPTGSYDISAFVASNTQIRFSSVTGISGTGETIAFDNINIAASGGRPGHFELRVDMTDAVNTDTDEGNDINAFGIRAHDGTSGAGGTELNVYYDTHTGYGVNPPTSGSNTRNYTYYPYITSGCSFAKNDFDFDDNVAGTQGTVGFTSRLGTFTQNFGNGGMSDNDVWETDPVTGYTSAVLSRDYGIWEMAASITSYVNAAGQNGNYGNIYLTNYADLAGGEGDEPTTNPTPNTFRVYLPTDANGAPLKPYVEQFYTYGGSGGNNGPTTPTQGQTSIFTVNVRVVNPTAHAITFNTTTNRVRANVPGGVVRYQGGAAATQGTIDSTPIVNQLGADDVVWSPGSVAAGATVFMSYRVAVTPTSTTATIAVTGTASSGNGTRAQFVDETGNATQGRSTYLAGGICELTVDPQDTVTPVVVSRVATRQSPEGVVVEWETASEVGAAGFDVYRWQPASKKWLKINDRLVPALIGAPQGGRYQVPDPGASPSGRYWYSIREVEVEGRAKSYGPFEASPALDNPATLESAVAAPRPRKPGLALLTASAASDVTVAVAQKKAAKVVTPALKVGVTRTGLVLVPTATLAQHFGLTPESVVANLAGGRFNLTNRGQRLAWLPASGDRGLLFYGEALDSPYARDNVYWLKNATGLIAEPLVTAAPTAAGGGSFLEAVHAEHDALPATVVTTNPNSDYWFWDGVNAGDPVQGKKAFTVNAPHLVPGQNPTLLVHLSSATSSNVKNEHHVIIRLNGVPVGEARWRGIAARTVKTIIGPGLLHEGANLIEVEGVLDPGVPLSIVYVDSFDLGYPRDFTASDNVLAFRGDGASTVTLTDFADAGILVLDVTDPRRPRPLTGVTVDEAGGHFRASVTPQSASARYYAVSEAGWQAPAWTEGDEPSNLKAKTGGADYVVVTTRELLGPAQRLASLRSSGLSTLVVDIQDVYDEYSTGLQDPRALAEFLKSASTRWATPPRFLAIAGRGNFDYKNAFGVGGNLVPPLMVATPRGLFASDTALGDVNAQDGVPEIAVGRIPVLSVEEFDAYIDKLEAYESAPAPETARKAVLIADAPDGGVDFAIASQAIAAGLPTGYDAAPIHLQTGEDIAVPRAELFAQLEGGADLVNYTGHGALDRLAAEGLLTSADVPGLENTQTPILTALSCTINRFEVPGFAPLGEELVKKAGSGFVAAWAPTGLSIHNEATLLGKAFYRGLGSYPGSRLGDAVNRAFKGYIDLGGLPWMPDIYSLLGDPALLLKDGVVNEGPDEGPPNPTTE